MGSKGAEPPSHTNCLTYGPSRRSAYGPSRRSTHGVKGCTTHNSQPFPAPTVRPRTQPTIRSRTLSHASNHGKYQGDNNNKPTIRPIFIHGSYNNHLPSRITKRSINHMATQQLNHLLPSHVCFQALRFSHHIFPPISFHTSSYISHHYS